MAPDTQQMVIPLSATSGDEVEFMAAKSKRKQQDDLGEIVLIPECDGWRMKQFAEFEETIKGGDYEDAYAALAAVIAEWPFDLDPSDATSYDKISGKSYVNVCNAALRNFTTATGPRKIKPQDIEVKPECVDWLMAEIRAFERRLRTSYASGYAALAEVIVAWPFESDPSDVESYEQLTAVEYTQLTHAVSQSFFR